MNLTGPFSNSDGDQFSKLEVIDMDKYDAEVIAPGDRASKLAKDICVASYGNNAAVQVIPRQPGNFRGPVDLAWKKTILQQMLEDKITWNVQNDGAGGKPQFFSIIGTEEVFERLGWEIIVMVIDDIARNGGYPVVFSNDVNAQKVTEENFHLVKAMFRGMGQILKETDQVNITGEFAIMQHSVCSFFDRNSKEQLILNWAGTGIGLTRSDRVIDGSRIGLGMPIVGFWEPGYRCNGGTQFTNLIIANWAVVNGVKGIWDSQDAMKFIEQLTIPSLSYAKTLTRANGWLPGGKISDPLVDMTGIAHLTGGGVGKFKELLPVGIGARLDNMPKPANVLLQAQQISRLYPDLKMSDEKCHTTFHGGCGMMVVCATEKDAHELIVEAETDLVKAQIIGETVESETNDVIIDSKFLEGRTITL
jgi:phosphoribosylaminoimidazole (AIR) synthetase